MRKRKIKLTESEYDMFMQVSNKLFKLAKTMEDNDLYIHKEGIEDRWLISLDEIEQTAHILETLAILATNKKLVLMEEEKYKKDI